MGKEDAVTRRVFISYSWTSEEHTEWVADLGERLMADGIDVVLDQWSLQDGQDVTAFMEKMVSDSSISRVIIISDSLYAEKADGRRGGVGTETQIISKNVYETVEQTKFVPVLRERDGEGKPCLPVFLQSRKYIDFTDSANEAESYDQLLRNILERPRRPKPALGTVPAHIVNDDAVSVPSSHQGKRFREFVSSGKGNASAAFEEFARQFVADFEDIRMTFDRKEEESWCQRLRDNIGRPLLTEMSTSTRCPQE